MVADCRSELGQRGLDLDVGPSGPVFWKWFDGCFQQRNSPAAVNAVRSELSMIMNALDEFRQGRVMEVADILASRARMLSFGTDALLESLRNASGTLRNNSSVIVMSPIRRCHRPQWTLRSRWWRSARSASERSETGPGARDSASMLELRHRAS